MITECGGKGKGGRLQGWCLVSDSRTQVNGEVKNAGAGGGGSGFEGGDSGLL